MYNSFSTLLKFSGLFERELEGWVGMKCLPVQYLDLLQCANLLYAIYKTVAGVQSLVLLVFMVAFRTMSLTYAQRYDIYPLFYTQRVDEGCGQFAGWRGLRDTA